MCMNEMYNSNNSIYIVRSLSLSSILQSLNKTHKFSSRSLTNLSCVQQTKLSNTCLTTDDFDANYNRENISMSNCKQTNAREMDLFNDKTEANNGCELSTNSSSNPTTYYHVGSGNDRNVSTVDEVLFSQIPFMIHQVL
uniref:Uncharacterized protein n=1 Tax=Trichobilharzia regenti TaxID=157069 RepID=A0AA85JSW1_TRIRE|nr:unnamed protein product [Trichobilharzia regenti]